MNNEFNERMMQKQMDYNTMMWNKQNAYNTPSEQRARLESAGMNPYMMLNGGSAGNAQAAGSTSAASAASAAPQQAFHPDFSGIPQSILMAKQGANIDADTEGKVIDNQTRARRNMQEIANMIVRTKNKQVETKLNETMLSYADQMQKEQLRNLTAQTEKHITERMMMDSNLKVLPEMLRLDLSQKAANVLLTRSQRNLTDKQALVEVEKGLETIARTAGIKLQNAQIVSLSRYALEKAANEAKRSGEPQNVWQGFADGRRGFNNFAEEYIGKPSEKFWKRTKRAFGIR